MHSPTWDLQPKMMTSRSKLMPTSRRSHLVRASSEMNLPRHGEREMSLNLYQPAWLTEKETPIRYDTEVVSHRNYAKRSLTGLSPGCSTSVSLINRGPYLQQLPSRFDHRALTSRIQHADDVILLDFRQTRLVITYCRLCGTCQQSSVPKVFYILLNMIKFKRADRVMSWPFRFESCSKPLHVRPVTVRYPQGPLSPHRFFRLGN